jgi:Cof subfamily protein (haloacid dehalogenase superfamily)
MIETIAVLAADVDMTLSEKGGVIGPKTREAFIILQAHDVRLGLATGREIDDLVLTDYQRWGLPRPFDFYIGMNGGMLRDTRKGTSWSMPMMTIDQMKELLTFLMPVVSRHRVAVNVEGGGNHNAMYVNALLKEAALRHKYPFVDKTGDIDGFCDRPCYKFLFRTNPTVTRQLREMIDRRYHGVYQTVETYPGTIEIMAAGIDKGSGLIRYLQDNGLSAEETIAFGDNENDDPLLRAAGWGVCVKNGAAGTKAAADDVTEKTCRQDGVGHYLFTHYLIPKGWAEGTHG